MLNIVGLFVLLLWRLTAYFLPLAHFFLLCRYHTSPICWFIGSYLFPLIFLASFILCSSLSFPLILSATLSPPFYSILCSILFSCMCVLFSIFFSKYWFSLLFLPHLSSRGPNRFPSSFPCFFPRSSINVAHPFLSPFLDYTYIYGLWITIPYLNTIPLKSLPDWKGKN